MIADKRYEEIIQLTDRLGFVSTRQLAVQMDVSETTIRRDVEELDRQGRLIRIHGGAKSLHKAEITTTDQEKSMRQRTITPDKVEAARKAAEFVKEGDCIFLDGGTSLVPLAQILKDRKVRIVTHSTLIADVMSDGPAELYLLGGKYLPAYNMCVGPNVLESLHPFQFHTAFLGCLGLDAQTGNIYTAEVETAAVKIQAARQSVRTILLADKEKFEIKGFYSIMNAANADLVITSVPDNIEELPNNFLKV
jgi:DeoR family fructose operon transcriptional repressor